MKHRLLIVIWASLSMMGALSIDAYLPALPAIAHVFSATMPAAQQTLTVYLSAFAFMTLFYGTLSDSFGRRPIILISLVLYFLSSVGASCATSLGQLFVFRLLQGLSAGAGGVVGRAMVGDLLTGAEAQRTMSYISVVFGLAPAIAPILGGWLQAAFGWRSIFFFLAFFTFVLLVACLRFLPESLPREKRHPFQFKIIMANYWQVASHIRFVFRALGAALSFSGIMLYVASAPAFVINLLHLKVTQFGWLFVPIIGGMTLGSMMAGKLSHRLSRQTMIQTGYTIMGLACTANLLENALFPLRLPWAVLPMFFYGFGMALTMSAMNVIMLEMFPKVRGLSSSLQSFLFMLVFAVGSGAISPLLFDSAFKLAAGASVGLLLSLFFWWLGSRHPEIPEPQPEIIPLD